MGSDLFFADLLGFLAATLLGAVWIFLPGTGLARLVALTGQDMGRGWPRIGWSLLLAFTLMPAIDALLVRAGGMIAMAGLHGLLAIYGLLRPRLLWPDRVADWRIAVPLLLLWLGIVGFDFVDFPTGDNLNQSLLDLDLVKHAAVTSAIAREGLPFVDPFFARPGYVGYYYYYYLWPALLHWSSGFLINARMAFAGSVFWTGLAFVSLLWRISAEGGLIRPGRIRAYMGLILLFCFVSGADMIVMLLRLLVTGRVEAQSDWWNVAVNFAVHSTLWVPHHLTAMIAAWGAMLLLARAQETSQPGRWALTAAAGAGIATCFGSSVWMMLTIAPVLVGWGCLAILRRDALLPFAGIVALALASVQIADLIAFRHDSGLPVAFNVRPFTVLLPEGGAWTWLHLVLLPLNYGIEFGIFGVGAIAWLRSGQYRPDNAVQTLLVASALSSLLVATFLKSTILNNDLAWRSIWFAQCAAMIWTAAWLQGPTPRLRDHPRMMILLALGMMAVAWDVVGMRLIRPPYVATSFSELISPRADDDDQRRVYEWAAHALPLKDVIQHNPALHRRIFNFGLYGVQRTGVSDREANLFGASPEAVRQRVALLRPIFETHLSSGDIRRRAEAAGVDHLLFASVDPIWRKIGGPPEGLRCERREPLACMVAVKDIGS
ncbi:hypothetical protein SAMN05518849_10517 [Sphingobium sp. AP50]|uniref:hypothetical protein n=1 Tax=Sphingobium sp. AP50 TaxID=1884369 RepID=UPI0008D209ED|nr:hypothetical protein [Sphingobium sp. AP50]SEJ31457.1 hypothetical protein SAMN05518849_10517 [Sphingobium sp. AP50]